MDAFERPKVFISRCIEHQACRWNAMMIGCPFVRALKPNVDFTTLCPEADIGLGIPREPIRVIREAGELRLYQVATGKDLTKTMKAFCEEQIPHLAGLDGFILKEKSPSCGNSSIPPYLPGLTFAG